MEENKNTGRRSTASSAQNSEMENSTGNTGENTGRQSSRRQNSNNENNMDGGKYGHLYNMIDAFLDNIDMPRNRTRALKFGVRAIGEFFLNNEEQGRARQTQSSNEGSKKTKKNKGGHKMRRG